MCVCTHTLIRNNISWKPVTGTRLHWSICYSVDAFVSRTHDMEPWIFCAEQGRRHDEQGSGTLRAEGMRHREADSLCPRWCIIPTPWGTGGRKGRSCKTPWVPSFYWPDAALGVPAVSPWWLLPSYSQGNWDPKKVSNKFKAPQPVRGRQCVKTYMCQIPKPLLVPKRSLCWRVPWNSRAKEGIQ